MSMPHKCAGQMPDREPTALRRIVWPSVHESSCPLPLPYNMCAVQSTGPGCQAEMQGNILTDILYIYIYMCIYVYICSTNVTIIHFPSAIAELLNSILTRAQNLRYVGGIPTGPADPEAPDLRVAHAPGPGHIWGKCSSGRLSKQGDSRKVGLSAKCPKPTERREPQDTTSNKLKCV